MCLEGVVREFELRVSGSSLSVMKIVGMAVLLCVGTVKKVSGCDVIRSLIPAVNSLTCLRR